MHSEVATRRGNFEIERHRDGKDRPIVIVLGAHCSGAPLLGHVLRVLGVDMADEGGIPDSHDSPAAAERPALARLQDQVLETIGRPVTSIAHGMPLAAGWWRDRAVQRAKSDICDWIGGELARTKGLWGFEDPRTVRLLPLWREILREMNLTPRFVVALRSPHDLPPPHAQRDLDRRPLMAIEGELHWLAYNYDVLRLLRVQRGLVIDHADWTRDPEQTAQRLVEELALEPGMDIDEQGECVSAIVRTKLRHRERDGRPQQPSFPLADGLYETIRTFDTAQEDSNRTSMVLSMLDVTFRALSPVLKIAAQLAPAKVELISATDALRKAQSEIAALREDDRAAEDALQNAALQEGLDETRYELKRLEEKSQAEAASRKAQAAEQAKALEEVRHRAARLEKDLKLSNEAHKKEIEAHQSVRRVFDQAAEKLANARQDLAKAKQDLIARTEAAAQLRVSAEAGAKELQNASARLTSLENETEQLRRRDSEAAEQTRTLTKARDDLAGEIEQLRHTGQEAAKQAQVLTMTRDDLARENQKLRHREQESIQRAEALTQARDDLAREVEQLQSLLKDREDLAREVEQLQSLLKEREDLAREIEQLQSLLKDRDDVERENEQLRHREREAAERTQILSASHDQLKIELQSALERYGELNETAAAVGADRDALAADLTAERGRAELAFARLDDELLISRARAGKVADLEHELAEERRRAAVHDGELKRLDRDHALALAAIEQETVGLRARFAQELADHQRQLADAQTKAGEDRAAAAEQIAKLDERSNAADQTRRALEDQIAAIYASRSWKLGAPLRAAMRTVKGSKSPGPRSG